MSNNININPINNNNTISINKKKIAAIVVTYNRLELLKKVINGLRTQTKSIDKIIIVNNSSTDGTSEWLGSQEDLEVITQENLGSSGGQFSGAVAAFEAGYEWIWQMDDDVVAASSALENLLKYASPDLVTVPKRIANNGSVFYNDTKKINFTNPFKSIWQEIVSEKDFDKELVFVDGMTLEGPLFHKSVYERIGFVEKDFFISADDTEYAIRMKKAGIRAAIVPSAIFYRQLPYPEDTGKYDWKTYYIIRNLIAMDVIHGNKYIRIIRPLGYFITWLMRCKNFNNIKTVFRAFKDGYFYESSNSK